MDKISTCKTETFKGKDCFLFIFIPSVTGRMPGTKCSEFLNELNVVTVFKLFQWLLVILRNPCRVLILAFRVPQRPVSTHATLSPHIQPHQVTACSSFVDRPYLYFPLGSCLHSPSPQLACFPSTLPGRTCLSLPHFWTWLALTGLGVPVYLPISH